MPDAASDASMDFRKRSGQFVNGETPILFQPFRMHNKENVPLVCKVVNRAYLKPPTNNFPFSSSSYRCFLPPPPPPLTVDPDCDLGDGLPVPPPPPPLPPRTAATAAAAADVAAPAVDDCGIVGGGAVDGLVGWWDISYLFWCQCITGYLSFNNSYVTK